MPKINVEAADLVAASVKLGAYRHSLDAMIEHIKTEGEPIPGALELVESKREEVRKIIHQFTVDLAAAVAINSMPWNDGKATRH